MLKVLELFAGIGACSKALTNLGVEHEIVDAVEVDPYAVKSFNAVHGTNFEPQDIKEWDKDIDVDLIMHGSPCQDFSSAGLQRGGDEGSGTRSSLMYETLRIVEKLKPKYVIWENVKNLLSKKHIHNFENYIRRMESLGYNSSYQVLNAKDYGVPQNRERVFTVSILGGGRFTFPEPMPLTKKLADVLEDEVDEKYYLSDEQVAEIVVPTESQKSSHREPEIVARTDTHQKGGVYSSESVSPTITATTYKQPTQIAEPRTTRGGVIASTIRASIHKQGTRNLIENVNNGRGYEGVLEPRGQDYRIRKLTPKECWRLMGFGDEDFGKAAEVNSNTQLYKQAGNSIVVDVLYNIFKELLNGKDKAEGR